ncbi:hypothetical protein ACFU76_35675 [Streptomyces sp. NPDC057539]|uniref:hypothetical protein n=1 Tax=Streptomyces sp. NPDC057539 TaxID=3346159 RepID=UPI0036B22998
MSVPSLVQSGLWSEENPLAEQLKSDAAEHLALEHLDPVDMAFDRARAPGQGESGGDGVEVAVDVGGEAVDQPERLTA